MKQVYNILPGNRQPPEQALLSIRVGERHFGFAISSPDGQELYQLALYTNEEMNEYSLGEIYRQEPALGKSYDKIQVCYDHPQSVLVPIAYYKEEDRGKMLHTLYGVSSQDKVMTEAIAEWQINNVYSIPMQVHEWTAQHFVKGNFHHCYSVGIRHIESTNFEGSMIVDFRPDEFSILVSKANKLLLARTFPYSNPADVIYYLLKTCQEYGFTQEQVRLSLSGLIDKESVLYREIYQYFIHVSFRESSWGARNQDDSPYPAHFFTSLNDLARCAS